MPRGCEEAGRSSDGVQHTYAYARGVVPADVLVLLEVKCLNINACCVAQLAGTFKGVFRVSPLVL
jgi:hypothetical protein